MWPFSRQQLSDTQDEIALAEVVRPFDHRTRQALYAATNSGALRRQTWNGCALNRAGAMLGTPIDTQYQAADVLNLPPRVIANFVGVWDRLRGPDKRCTALLRSAILTVGLFPESGPTESCPGASTSEPSEVEHTTAVTV